jgi:hypothetical protein
VLGAVVAAYEGVSRIRNPEPIENPLVNYVVLLLSAIFEGATWWVALRNFKGDKPYAALLQAVRESKDPPSFVVFFENS